jgi:hypothetical protein
LDQIHNEVLEKTRFFIVNLTFRHKVWPIQDDELSI